MYTTIVTDHVDKSEGSINGERYECLLPVAYFDYAEEIKHACKECPEYGTVFIFSFAHAHGAGLRELYRCLRKRMETKVWLRRPWELTGYRFGEKLNAMSWNKISA